ncbi:MAG: GAF domain-containing protein [Planctomycetota bacterium]
MKPSVQNAPMTGSPHQEPLALDALLEIVEAISAGPDAEFFPVLAAHLARLMGTSHALVAQVCSGSTDRASTLAYWTPKGPGDQAQWDIAGTPMAEVLKGQIFHMESGVRARFPGPGPLADMGIDSYLGAPLNDGKGFPLGFLCVFNHGPMPLEPWRLALFRVFASRAAAQLARLSLERELAESQERFRDLFDEAPIAYVHEGIDSRFIRANRAAMRTLGITPDQVEGTYGK